MKDGDMRTCSYSKRAPIQLHFALAFCLCVCVCVCVCASLNTTCQKLSLNAQYTRLIFRTPYTYSNTYYNSVFRIRKLVHITYLWKIVNIKIMRYGTTSFS